MAGSHVAETIVLVNEGSEIWRTDNLCMNSKRSPLPLALYTVEWKQQLS